MKMYLEDKSNKLYSKEEERERERRKEEKIAKIQKFV